MWLLEARIRQAIQQAQKAGCVPSAEEQTKYEARFITDAAEGNSRILTVAGNVAEIAIKGVLTQAPSFMAMLFGGGNTTYPEIISAIAMAEQDDAISETVFRIDSPGGQFDGLFDTIAAIQSAKKPSKAIISNLGASAAFALATQADEVVASNIAARIGSVGVVATFDIDPNEISITSTEAPAKRPDVSTPEGVAMVVEELDALHEIFVEAIAKGRGTTVEKVNADFGQGGTVLAKEAIKRGMIDSIAGVPLKVVKSAASTTATSGNQPEAKIMDLNQLRTEHPDTFAAAVKEGTDGERDRVIAHLTAGEMSGDNKTASAAIKDGAVMTMTLQTQYMMAGMNRNDLANRQGDEAGTGDAADNVDAQDDQGAPADTVANILESKLGIGE